MNVLITGSSGFLGRHVANEFLLYGHKVYGISRSIVESKYYQQYSIDINDFDTLNRLISEKSIDVIVHTAGKPIVIDCEKNPYDAYKTNGLGTASILECARINGVKKVISVETDKVYGFQKVVPTSEVAKLNPKSAYEYSKCIASNFADFYRNFYNLNVISVRPANLFGPNDFATSRIIPKALANIKNGKGIRLYDTSLNMFRDFIYVKDAARAIYILSTKKCNHTKYNISMNQPISMLDLANRIASTLNSNIPHEIVKKEVEYKEIPAQAIDGSRFKDEFGFVFTPFETALLETWKENQQ